MKTAAIQCRLSKRSETVGERSLKNPVACFSRLHVERICGRQVYSRSFCITTDYRNESLLIMLSVGKERSIMEFGGGGTELVFQGEEIDLSYAATHHRAGPGWRWSFPSRASYFPSTRGTSCVVSSIHNNEVPRPLFTKTCFCFYSTPYTNKSNSIQAK